MAFAISLSASGQPSGVTVSFNPASIAAPGSGSSPMTMAVASSTASGTYTITITGNGGGITHTVTVSLAAIPASRTARRQLLGCRRPA
jgi:phosphoheptose isomerase